MKGTVKEDLSLFGSAHLCIPTGTELELEPFRATPAGEPESDLLRITSGPYKGTVINKKSVDLSHLFPFPAAGEGAGIDDETGEVVYDQRDEDEHGYNSIVAAGLTRHQR